MKIRSFLYIGSKTGFWILATMLFLSCSSAKKLGKNYTYFQEGLDSTELNLKETLIQSNDLLGILVFSKTVNQEQTAIFNIPNAGAVGAQGSSGGMQGYRVSLLGTIEVPLIGPVKAAGLTTADLQNALIYKLSPYIKDPSVIIKLLQFKVNVLGEVRAPGVHSFQSDKVTILDAISAAQDLTDYGRREDVMVIREENGQRHFYKIDLRNGNLFKSPAYQLQPNDLVYVSPNRNKLSALNINADAQRKTSFFIGITSALIGVTSLIVNLTR